MGVDHLNLVRLRFKVTNGDDVHSVRVKRNQYAHEPNVYSTWESLAEDLQIIENALLELNLIEATGDLEYFAERSAMESSEKPGVSFTRKFAYGVKVNEKRRLEISWNQDLLESTK